MYGGWWLLPLTFFFENQFHQVHVFYGLTNPPTLCRYPAFVWQIQNIMNNPILGFPVAAWLVRIYQSWLTMLRVWIHQSRLIQWICQKQAAEKVWSLKKKMNQEWLRCYKLTDSVVSEFFWRMYCSCIRLRVWKLSDRCCLRVDWI